MPEGRASVDVVLTAFLDERDRAIEGLAPGATLLIGEVRRLLEAGGKRIRPAFCCAGFVAGGGPEPAGSDEPIVRAASALELLHTMAIVHDDLIDGAKERRGVPATSVWFSERAGEFGARGDPEEFGRAMAVVVGDVAAVWADLLFLGSGFSPGSLARALAEYHVMREQMAVGQVVERGGAAGDREVVRRAARLRGGAYSVEGPLLIGATLAGASEEVRACLRRYGRALGEAFQLRDDLEDGDAPAGVTPETVSDLVWSAKASLDPAVVDRASILELERLADLVAS